MSDFLTLEQAELFAKRIQPNWIAVNKDGHIMAHVCKPQLGIIRGYWISKGFSWDLGFYKEREEWENTLHEIKYG